MRIEHDTKALAREPLWSPRSPGPRGRGGGRGRAQPHHLLGLLQLLLPPHLLGLPGLLCVLLLQQPPVSLHSFISPPDESQQLSHKLILLLPGFVPRLSVFLLHGPFLPAVGSLSGIVLLFPSKVLLGAETLPVRVERVDYLVTERIRKTLVF